MRYGDESVSEQAMKRILEERFEPELLAQIIEKLKADKLL
jgi:hypothetical protein